MYTPEPELPDWCVILHRYYNYDINVLYKCYGKAMAIYYDSSDQNIMNFTKYTTQQKF